MPNTPAEAVADLLVRWKDARDAGHTIRPEALCADQPDLLPRVREAVRAYTILSRLTGTDLPDTPTGPDTPLPAAVGGYRVSRLLGAGGMGTVYAAYDVHLQREVAVKVMRPELAGRPDAAARFRREARAQAKLSHDHVLPVYHVGEADGQPYIVMPLLAGETLEARLGRERPLSPAMVARIGRQAAEGLAVAHAKGLIHRDIKPSNLWLEDVPDGRRVKVLDFGLARAVDPGDDRLTGLGTLLGTPRYMAPEQAAHHLDPNRPAEAEVDHRADLFSLGVVLYEAATGTAPFRRADPASALAAIAADDPPPPCAVNSAVPILLSDLIQRLMAKAAVDRPPSAQAVVDELRRIEAVLTLPVAEPPSDPHPRHPGEAVGQPEAGPHLGQEIRRPFCGGWRKQRVWAVAVALPLFAVIGAAALQVIRIATPRGTLVIEADDPGVEVVVRKDGAVVRDKTRDRELELIVGNYTIELTDQKDGLTLSTDRFTITRGGKEVVRVRLDPPPPSADPERRVAEWVLKAGGVVTVETMGDSPGSKDVTDVRALPAQPFKVLAVSFFETAREVVVDETADNLRPLAALRKLALLHQPLTGAGLARLATFPWAATLTDLELTGSAVGPAGYAHLPAFRSLVTFSHNNIGRYRSENLGPAQVDLLNRLSLTVLSLHDRGLTEEAVARLNRSSLTNLNLNANRCSGPKSITAIGQLTNLTTLELSAAGLQDDHLGHLRGLTRVEYLNLADNPQLTDEGIGKLPRLPGLRQVLLSRTGVKGAIIQFAEFGRLQTVECEGCPGITDDTLRALAKCPELKKVTCSDTAVTAGAIANLARALPRCHIVWGGGEVGPNR